MNDETQSSRDSRTIIGGLNAPLGKAVSAEDEGSIGMKSAGQGVDRSDGLLIADEANHQMGSLQIERRFIPVSKST